jgi:hypothetical protein
VLKVAPEMGFAGIATAGNTHQVAQAMAPESRVVYADYDPVVLAPARALLTSAIPARSLSRPVSS